MAKKDKKHNALSQVLEDTEKELKEARAQKEYWTKKEQETEAFLRQLKQRMGLSLDENMADPSISEVRGVAPAVSPAQGKIYLKMGLNDAILAYLKSAEEVSSPAQIAQALLSGGFLTKNPKNLGTMVSTQLGRMPEALRLGSGKWALKEWRK